eukprot:CAMPEP_0177683136 /NCGR_PEP_ID=MMETSP0447-20121125/31628_1 /TAXON_ID=0 /ORGANISM="Stygamoeba regulata, Strain BSH-02190019" /LENGTH=348 /DNA_ID=CAMNT_0019192679 /DNA_START=239 /DNA_END=1285 /DNA_ORIENTATION=-
MSNDEETNVLLAEDPSLSPDEEFAPPQQQDSDAEPNDQEKQEKQEEQEEQEEQEVAQDLLSFDAALAGDVEFTTDHLDVASGDDSERAIERHAADSSVSQPLALAGEQQNHTAPLNQPQLPELVQPPSPTRPTRAIAQPLMVQEHRQPSQRTEPVRQQRQASRAQPAQQPRQPPQHTARQQLVPPPQVIAVGSQKLYSGSTYQAPAGSRSQFAESVPQAPSRFNEGLFDCVNDPTSCCLAATCCTGSVIGAVAHELHGHNACAVGCLWSLLQCFTLCGNAFLGAYYRSHLRARYNIPGNIINDCLLHTVCPCCAVTQEYREMRSRGSPPSLCIDELLENDNEEQERLL